MRSTDQGLYVWLCGFLKADRADCAARMLTAATEKEQRLAVMDLRPHQKQQLRDGGYHVDDAIR